MVALSLLALNAAAGETAAPELRVTVQNAPLKSAGIMVEASDNEGLAALQISCPVVDSSYTTQLSRLAVGRQFRRIFTLAELCPGIESRPEVAAIQLDVAVRNTRGISARAPAQVQLSSPR